jgi:nucleotide-binding universal stress UspA family protein
VFEHILLATDLSETSEGAFRIATDLARAQAARLTLLYVYEVSAHTIDGISESEAERSWPGPVRIRGELDAIATGLRATGIRADVVVRFGDAAQRIAEVAREEGVDLVVTGTHRRTGLRRLWYGSVAEQVLRRSSAPVLAVPMRSANVIAIGPRRRRLGRRSAPSLTSTTMEPRGRG